MPAFDPGPPAKYKALFATVPDYKTVAPSTTGDDVFWYAFGPVFYRGRLDGSARVLAIASDPGETECLPFVRRCLVGDSGQRAQGFLAKLGLDRSYVLVNAFACALHPSHKDDGVALLQNNAALAKWRHQFYNQLLADNSFQAIISFGKESHTAYDVWAAANPQVANVKAFRIAHPSAIDRPGNAKLLKEWTGAITTLRGIVTSEVSGALPANYGAAFKPADYSAIPRGDFGADAPAYVGNGKKPHNCATRPHPDDGTSLWLTPPKNAGSKLRYVYKNGKLHATYDEAGKKVKTTPTGIPI